MHAPIWIQKDVRLKSRPRGFHLVTDEVMAQIDGIDKIRVGLAHFFIQHTSASLTLNENADPDVREDFSSHFDRAVPDGAPYYRHTTEGPDDMSSHLKASILGSGVVVPIRDGRLHLGTWQGLYLCEHRDQGGARRLVVTVWGSDQ
jgi:secondary thiamine-phosphate synthase enzyme